MSFLDPPGVGNAGLRSDVPPGQGGENKRSSREAAEECSPRRKPWDGSRKWASPGGAEETLRHKLKRDATRSRDKLQPMPRVLIVAYGNPMRCDDGLAWRAADDLEKKFPHPDVEILRRHQLAPELAETVSHSEAVIFVDAASAGGANGQPGEVRSSEVTSPEGAPRFSHQLSPSTVIALARQLYSASPHAFSVTLTGQCFDHGESLSPVVKAALPALVMQIETLLRTFLLPPAFPPNSGKP